MDQINISVDGIAIVVKNATIDSLAVRLKFRGNYLILNSRYRHVINIFERKNDQMVLVWFVLCMDQ